jgi:hypothetical protein
LNAELHVSSYRRWLWEDAGLLVVEGSFDEALRSRAAYQQRHGIQPPIGPGSEALERLLAAAGMAALSLAERESWGWSMTLPGADFGLFCAVEPEGMVCGTVREADPNNATVVLQRQRAGEPLVQSHYEPLDDNPVAAVQRYFEKVGQIATRICLDTSGAGALVQAIPGGSFASVTTLDDETLLELVRDSKDSGTFKLLDEVLLFYECRCDDQQILDMIASLSDTDLADIWRDQTELEIECPRCGRSYTIRRRSIPARQ